MSHATPTVRKGQYGGPLDRDAVRDRFVRRFQDPAFAAERGAGARYRSLPAYATRHEELDCDAAVWQGARNVSRVNLLPRLGHGDRVERDHGIHDPRPK